MNVQSIIIARENTTDSLITITAVLENGTPFISCYKANQLQYLQGKSNGGGNADNYSFSIGQEVFNGTINSDNASVNIIAPSVGLLTPSTLLEMQTYLQPVFLDTTSGGAGGSQSLQQVMDVSSLLNKSNIIDAADYDFIIQHLVVFLLEFANGAYFNINADGELSLRCFNGTDIFDAFIQKADGSTYFDSVSSLIPFRKMAIENNGGFYLRTENSGLLTKVLSIESDGKIETKINDGVNIAQSHEVNNTNVHDFYTMYDGDYAKNRKTLTLEDNAVKQKGAAWQPRKTVDMDHLGYIDVEEYDYMIKISGSNTGVINLPTTSQNGRKIVLININTTHLSFSTDVTTPNGDGITYINANEVLQMVYDDSLSNWTVYNSYSF